MGLNYMDIRYLKLAAKGGWIPPERDMIINTLPESYCDQKFFLRRSLRSRVVAMAFDRPEAVKIIWNSAFGNFIHKILYFLSGNPVRETVSKIENK
jgi:hypothetical protein